MGSFYPTTTLHSEIVTTFERDSATGVLLAARNNHENELLAVSSYPTWPVQDSLLPTYRRFQHSATAAGLRYVVYELHGAYGVLFRARTDQDNTELRDYTAYLLVKSAAHQPILRGPVSAGALDTASRIATLFEQRLLFDAFQYKGWNATGKELFTAQVAYYTAQNLMVDLALPAFPCKTTNPDKAASTLPDGAEFEALETLQAFCFAVEALYSPGCCISIVSDGHVFADCQGTDDVVVTEYSNALTAMNNFKDKAKRAALQCYNLDRLLFPDAQAIKLFKRVSNGSTFAKHARFESHANFSC